MEFTRKKIAFDTELPLEGVHKAAKRERRIRLRDDRYRNCTEYLTKRRLENFPDGVYCQTGRHNSAANRHTDMKYRSVERRRSYCIRQSQAQSWPVFLPLWNPASTLSWESSSRPALQRCTALLRGLSSWPPSAFSEALIPAISESFM